MSSVQSQIGVMATGVLTRAAPAYNHRTFTELQLVQPVLMARLSVRSFTFLGALNAEGYTLKRGELNAGIWGEGYVDRRHPHTLVHEAMVSWQTPTLRHASGATSTTLTGSVAAGRGFVPFGSDDPMMRPFEKYPVNHHHAQILERIQGIAAARITRGQQWLAVEGATFNGDEPAGPFHGPRWERVGDSWSVRATGQLLRGFELSASEASVKSPELQQGGAFDHMQHHVSVRFDRAKRNGDMRYVLAEWARTDEITNGKTAFRYPSKLIEGAFGWRRGMAALRLERTDRGEQMRLLDPFRAPLGHVDFQNLGVTQWNVITVAFKASPLSLGSPHVNTQVAPFVEVARATPSSRNHPTVFEPADFYGASTLWSVSVGLRMEVGSMRARMGRYGVLSGPSDDMGMSHGMNHDE
ncbi:MAG: hypothetical protein ABJB74_09185 [Gemmatimonas sp.]